jgi:dihydrofolate reductase
MRKLIESTLISLDGVIGDPHAFASRYFDAAAAQRSLEQLQRSDAMLMGRTTYQGFSKLWPSLSGPYPQRVNSMQKYVFSSELERADWTNTEIVRGDALRAIEQLKQEGDGDLILYGHGTLGQSLLAHGLLDELHLLVSPVFVGQGQLAFRAGLSADLTLLSAQALPTGAVQLVYKT